MKPFIIITGMHRSGTSFLARALNLYGVSLGNLESLLSHEWKSFEDNPRGHWENRKLYELSEETLKNSKGSWHKVPKKIVVSKKISKELKNCINELQDLAIFASGFKDPRVLLCFDDWLRYFPKNFVVIGIIRDPLKVAESLKKRNNFSYDKSLNLWRIYNENLLALLKKHQCFLLDFDWPKKRLFDEIKLISKKLGLGKNIDLESWYTKDLLKSNKTYQSNYKLPSNILKLYSKLKKWTKTNKNVKIKHLKRSSVDNSSAIENLFAEFQNQNEYFTKLFNERTKVFNTNSKKLAKLQKEYDERSQWALSIDKELKQKNQDLNTLQKEYEERSRSAANGHYLLTRN